MVALLVILFFFFFQAEDGIRDLTVTGVQTCALPIFHAGVDQRLRAPRPDLGRVQARIEEGAPGRSEEHTSELQSQSNLVCRLLLEKKKKDALMHSTPALRSRTLLRSHTALVRAVACV